MQHQYLAGPNPLSPDVMSSKERLDELAEILATGLCRLQMRQEEQLQQKAELAARSQKSCSGGGHTHQAAALLATDLPSVIHP
jgi:hypothetical protein